MTTSINKNVKNKKSSDPFDKLIFEKGLRASQVIINKKLSLLLIILNNGKVLRVSLTEFPRLNKASQNQLSNWTLINGGIGIHWADLDEDLSLKGLIKDAALFSALRQLQGKPQMDFIL